MGKQSKKAQVFTAVLELQDSNSEEKVSDIGSSKIPFKRCCGQSKQSFVSILILILAVILIGISLCLILMKTEQQDTNKALNILNKEIQYLKDESENAKEGLERVMTALQGLQSNQNSTDTQVQEMVVDLQQAKSRLERMKTELEDIKIRYEEEQISNNKPGLPETLISSRIQSCGGVHQIAQNPLRRENVDLDLTLGKQNWHDGLTLSEAEDRVLRYLYGRSPRTAKWNWARLTSWNSYDDFVLLSSDMITKTIGVTDYNVKWNFTVDRETVDAVISFQHTGPGLNTLDQYQYAVLYVSNDITTALANCMLVDQICCYRFDKENWKNLFNIGNPVVVTLDVYEKPQLPSAAHKFQNHYIFVFIIVFIAQICIF